MEDENKGNKYYCNLKEHLWEKREQLIQKNDTTFWKKADFYWPITAKLVYVKHEAENTIKGPNISELRYTRIKAECTK